MTTRPTLARSTHPATMPASHDRVPIAIVGMGCRFPGGASSGDKFWDLITRKVSARRATPPDRFNIDAFYHPDGERNGTVSPSSPSLPPDSKLYPQGEREKQDANVL